MAMTPAPATAAPATSATSAGSGAGGGAGGMAGGMAGGGAGGGDGDGTPWLGGGAVARAVGKVSFTLDGTGYVCSGAAVGSPGDNVVVTAAHCVTNGTGEWARNWTFEPGYRDGKAPYGSYHAARFFVSGQWNAGVNEGYDVAFVTLRTPLSVPGLPVVFGQTPRRSYVFGYPAEQPYGGGRLDYCAGMALDDPLGGAGDSGLRCAMTAGDSGGPWLAGTPSGAVIAVSSFKYSDDERTLYGTRLGPAAAALYAQATRQ
jgi:hypothetical protein